MKTIRVAMLALVWVAAARADFSYTQTRKSSGGMFAGAAGDITTRHYLKGQKMKTDTGAVMSRILDLDAQTITTINHQQKTYTVTPFSELGQAIKDTGVEPRIDVKETGQKRNINGYNATEVLMTMEMETPPGPQQPGMKMVMEMSMWLSPDPPGTADLRAFYQRNGNKFPWAAMAGAPQASPGLQKAMADMQKKLATLGGVAVRQTIRMKVANETQATEQLLTRMGGTGNGSLFEITMESTGFSTAPIPDSVFAIPAGYQKKN